MLLVDALPSDAAAVGTVAAVHVHMMLRSCCFLDTHYCCCYLHHLMQLSHVEDSFGVKPDSADSSRRDLRHHSHLHGCCRRYCCCNRSYSDPISFCSNKKQLGYRYCKSLSFQRRLVDSDIR